MLKGYSRQPRSESQSLDYKFCVLFSIASDHGSHPEHCVEKLPNTSSVKNFRKSLLLSGSLVWGWWSEEKWDFHGDHFTEGHDQLPKDKHEAASKKHPRFPTSLPQTPQSGLRSDPQGLPSQISLHPTFFGCSLSLLSAFPVRSAACPVRSHLKDRPWAALCPEHSSWDGHMDGSFPSLMSLPSKVILPTTVPNYLYIKL